MINKNKKMVTLILVVIIGIVFIYTLFKVINFKNDQKIYHTNLKRIELNSIITDVAISRKTEIKIAGVNEWIRVGGCRLELSENQNDTKEYFIKGDSIIKAKNSNHFFIVRNSEKFSWVIE